MIHSKPLRVAFVTLGCAKNEVDSDKMRAALAASGFDFVDKPGLADCLVINTCAFITEATEESIAAILEAAELPEVINGQCKLVVAGCLPSRYADNLDGNLPEVVAFVPVGDEAGIAKIIAGLFDGYTIEAAPTTTMHKTQQSSRLRLPAAQNPWAYLKIAEGCSRHCSFCTIPKIRGPYTSYPIDVLLAESDELIANGARELVLIAQDTGLWHDGELGLPELLSLLAERYPDVWLRMMYLEPSGVTDKLLNVMAEHANICKYLDIPLQHANQKVLQNMNRSGSGDEFLLLTKKIRDKMPDVTLRTTLIAGFPGETRAEALELERFVTAAQFDYIGVFAYSQEEGTLAGERTDQVPRRTRLARAQRLRDLADAIGHQRVAARIGQTLSVLVTEYEDGRPIGRTQGQAPEVDGIVRLSQGSPGELVAARISDSLCYDLDGELIYTSEDRPEGGAR
ncbi:MAG: 30S ribosomal protein S12 methylthiotransferase RimO [Coriobacteriales bacterium]|jgi:ribosomal protein S12 methylthiotransferase|nr:30S ribosomal protein S12 methylthiotransferase RimO [Coriobacteriales bacterium]